MLRIDLALETSLATHEECLLTDLHLDRRSVCTELVPGTRADLLHGDADLITSGLLVIGPRAVLNRDDVRAVLGAWPMSNRESLATSAESSASRDPSTCFAIVRLTHILMAQFRPAWDEVAILVKETNETAIGLSKFRVSETMVFRLTRSLIAAVGFTTA